MLSVEYIKTKQEIEDVYDFCSKVDGGIYLDEDFQVERFKPSPMAWNKDNYTKYHLDEGLVEVCKKSKNIVGVSCFKKMKFLKTVIVQKLLVNPNNYDDIVKMLILSRTSNIIDQCDIFNKLTICVDDTDEKLMRLLRSIDFSPKYDKVSGQFNFTKEF